MVGHGVVGYLDTNLLADVGGLKFSTAVRHRCAYKLSRHIHWKCATDFKPGDFVAVDRFDLDARRRCTADQRTAFHRGHRIPVRSSVSAVGAAAFALPCGDAVSINLGIAKGSLRSTGIVAAVRH